jgi:putative spermidine/putrescine transport system permease protein
MSEKRPASFYWLALVFSSFVLFLYGPVITILVLSFQGPEGGLTLPMNGFSVHWFIQLWQGIGLIDISQGLINSLELGILVTALTVIMSLMAGLAFRRRFGGASALFYTAIGSLIMPSIVVSLGIALEFRILDDSIKGLGDSFEIGWIEDNYSTALGMFTSGLGAHLSWTLPFGLLIMFAIFNRFNRAYEEAARDMGASSWQTIRHVVVPMIAPSLIGVALFGFTLSWDELARSSQAMGSANTLPIELQALTTTVTTPAIYALGTTTTGVSFLVIGTALAVIFIVQRRRRRHGSDAGQGLV